MKFYIDTNILVDFILERVPHFPLVFKIFQQAIAGNIILYSSSHTFATAHYVSRKKFTDIELRKLLLELMDVVIPISVSEEILRKAANSHHKDFEDAIQIFCAHKIENLDAIITRNLKDFSTAEVNVFAPDEALNYIKNKQ
jgi:predicted nucleic acid-binding protein